MTPALPLLVLALAAAPPGASTPPGDLSGFRLLPLGPYALDARLHVRVVFRGAS